MEPKKALYNKKGPEVVKALKSRGFDAYYVSSTEEAVKKALEIIPPTDSVSYGGSQTVDELDIKNILTSRGNKVIDRTRKTETKEEYKELKKEIAFADTFLMSSNAVSEDGILVNIDGFAGRVGPMCWGPDSVVMFVGMNKVAKDLDSALTRARTVAAPMNSQRFESTTRPCYLTGKCADCKSPDTICSQIVITRFCRPAGRIKVILIGEELGM